MCDVVMYYLAFAPCVLDHKGFYISWYGIEVETIRVSIMDAMVSTSSRFKVETIKGFYNGCYDHDLESRSRP
jgi:hypothetical protein